jgi:uncharacterized protein
MTRPLWIALGAASLVTGLVGAVLPLLPTTPFLLLAAYSFARGSPSLHAWLIEHPRLGPVIEDWQRYGAIARRAKIAAVITIVATLAISVAVGVPAWLLTIQAVVLAGSAIFIVTRPDRPHGRPSP